MDVIHSRNAGLLAVLVAAPATLAPAQNDLDKEVRAEYAKVEAARAKMVSESEKVDEAEMGRRMKAYGGTVQAFIDRYSPRAERLTTGHYDLGRAHIQLFDFESAHTHLKKFLEMFPRHSERTRATMYLGDACRATGRVDEAVALYERLLAEGADAELLPDIQLQLATSYTLALRFDDAVKAYDKVLKNHKDHELAADAAVQLVNVLFYAGQYDRARAHIDTMLAESSDAPELDHLKTVASFLGRPAPELEGVQAWVGEPGTTVAKQRGRVLVLCFFTAKSVPCAHTLQTLSRIKGDMRMEGITVWGVSRAYYAAKKHMSLDGEKRMMDDYRKSPVAVLKKLLRIGDDELPKSGDLTKPITLPLALTLTDGFKNLRAYHARRVPHVVVIDKQGKVRLVEEAGQPDGGFQSRVLENVIRRLAVE